MKQKSKTKAGKSKKQGAYRRMLRAIAHFQVSRPYLTLFIIIVLTLAIYGGVAKVNTVASLEQMMPKNAEEIQAFNNLRDNKLGQDIIAVVLEIDRDSPNIGMADIKDYDVYYYVYNLKEKLRLQPDVLEAYAFTDLVSPTMLNRSEYANAIKQDGVMERLSEFINQDSTTTVILATTDVSANDPRMNLLSSQIKEITASEGHPPGVKVKFTGTPIIQQKLGELISKDRNNTKWLSTLLVFLITMLIFTTFTSALVPIIVVTLSVNWLYGTMGYTNLPISTLAGGVAAMVIGIGIDFAIHIMNKFKLERKKGLPIKESIELAVVETGAALTATSVTTIAAFLAFLSGKMPEMGRFGILMAIGIGFSLVFSIFGLPALLVIEEKLIYKLKRKLRFGVEGELKLTRQKGGRK